MPLPPNIKSHLQVATHSSHQHVTLELRHNILSSGNLIRHSAARMVNEPTPQQARTIDKILRLPKV